MLPLEKRYQVFVSSTYDDLREERQEVIQALLELKCFPAGMELFPAADDDQLTAIRNVIDDCDYYLVVVGGRYGSIDASTGKSYTQLEYEYAVDRGKPTIAFIHGNPSKIEYGKTEATDDGKRKLEAFCALLRRKLIKQWANPHELGAVVSRSMTQLIAHRPAVGWVRADQLPDKPAQDEILQLRRKIDALESDLRTRPLLVAPDLAHGKDMVVIKYDTYSGSPAKVTRTWDAIFCCLAPRMTTYIAREALAECLRTLAGGNARVIGITEASLSSILLQFRALGLIKSAQTAYGEQWTLTPQGDAYMVSLLAHRTRSIGQRGE
jgi:Domain of unknown function (DUF4062)